MLENLPQDRYDKTIKELFADGEEELISFFGHLKTKVVQHQVSDHRRSWF